MPKTVKESTCYYFFRQFPKETVSIVVLLFFSGLVESVGAVSIIPLLGSLISGESASNPIIHKVHNLFVLVGITPSLEMMLLVLCTSMLGKGCLTFFAFREIGYVEAEITANLRETFIDKLLHTRWSFFTSQPTGKLSYALTIEMTEAGAALGVLARTLALVIQAITYLCVAAFVSWQVLVAGLLCGLLLSFVFKGLISFVRNAGARRAASSNEMTAMFTDSLVGAKPLKIMNLADEYSVYLKKLVSNINKATKQHVSGIGLLTSLQEPFSIVFLAIGIYITVVKMNMEGTSILAMAFFFQRILTRISSAQQSFQQYAGYEGSLRSLLGKLEVIDENHDQISGGVQVEFSNSIDLKDVQFKYGTKKVLGNTSLSVKWGEITCFKGVSGSGKTTVVDAISGLIAPCVGSIEIDGVPLEEVDLVHWRSQIGYVPQEVFLFHDSIRANVVLGRKVDDDLVWKSLEEAGAREFVESLPEGLDTTVGEHGRALSGGQRQRLMIARAMYNRPRLLIFDEATSGLDGAVEAEIFSSLLQIKSRAAIIVVSHQGEIMNFADKVYDFGELRSSL